MTIDAGERERNEPPLTVFGPDFPFAYDDWIAHPDGLGTLPESALGRRVAVIGAGVSGMVAAHELMKLGLRPVVYEAGRIGGRLRSEPFGDDPEIVAELGGMRFPRSASTFYHYLNRLGLETRPFPNPLTEAAGTTVIDLGGVRRQARTIDDLPPEFRQMSAAWDAALESGAQASAVRRAMRERDADTLKTLWNPLVHAWDDRTFYDFIATTPAFGRLGFTHREMFGQVGFGTGGWDSDFRNTMLEILRVVLSDCDADQHWIVGGAERLPRGLWHLAVDGPHHPSGTSLASLHAGVPRPGVAGIARVDDARIRVTDVYGNTEDYPCGARHLPELAADDGDRHRRDAVLAIALDVARSHQLHAVGQDLRHGRQTLLARSRPSHRRALPEHDADRSADAWHLPDLPRRGSPGRSSA